MSKYPSNDIISNGHPLSDSLILIHCIAFISNFSAAYSSRRPPKQVSLLLMVTFSPPPPPESLRPAVFGVRRRGEKIAILGRVGVHTRNQSHPPHGIFFPAFASDEHQASRTSAHRRIAAGNDSPHCLVNSCSLTFPTLW